MTIIDEFINVNNQYRALSDSLIRIAQNPNPSNQSEIDTLYEQLPQLCQNSLCVLGILYKHGFILENLPAEKLNEIIHEGPHLGKSVVYALMREPLGLQTLLLHPNVLERITPEALNQIIPSGNEEGSSPVHWLMLFPDGKKIIAQYPDFARKISKKSFNAPMKGGLIDMASPFSILFASVEGLHTLENPHLLSCISTESLNRSLPIPLDRLHGSNGQNPRIAPIQAIAFNTDNMDFFICHLANFLDLISPEHLNTIVSQTGVSLLHTLFKNESFVYALANPNGNAYSPSREQISKFIQAISVEAFNRNIDEGFQTPASPCSLLCSSDDGCKLLFEYPRLVELIQEDAFNRPHWAGVSEDGMSAAYFLAYKNYGLALYEKYPHLANLINDAGWNSQPEQGDNEFVSLAQWVETCISRIYYLDEEPGSDILRAKLDERRRLASGQIASQAIASPIAVRPIPVRSPLSTTRTNMVSANEDSDYVDHGTLSTHGLYSDSAQTNGTMQIVADEDSEDELDSNTPLN